MGTTLNFVPSHSLTRTTFYLQTLNTSYLLLPDQLSLATLSPRLPGGQCTVLSCTVFTLDSVSVHESAVTCSHFMVVFIK